MTQSYALYVLVNFLCFLYAFLCSFCYCTGAFIVVFVFQQRRANATAAGWEVKEIYYLDSVTNDSCVFILLDSESIGVWCPFALFTDY